MDTTLAVISEQPFPSRRPAGETRIHLTGLLYHPTNGAPVMRIIASMTTIPSRIECIRPALESALAQDVAVEHLELNVPHFCLRTNEPYVLPSWLAHLPRVTVFRTEDYGAITKVAPTLLRHRQDVRTYVWSVDDDIAYPANQLEMLLRCHSPSQPRILTRHGGLVQPDGAIVFLYGRCEVTMFEGFGSVLYPPGCIGEDFLEYVETTSGNTDCRMSDDVVLSFYFSSRGVPIYLCNVPTDAEPFYPTGWLPHAQERDALSLQDGGHEERYKRVFEFLKSPRSSHATPSGPSKEATRAPTGSRA